MQRYAAPPEITKSGLLPEPPKIRLPKAEPLDNIAHRDTYYTENKVRYQKKALVKYVSNGLKSKLLDVVDSPLRRSYYGSMLCQSHILQMGSVSKARICNQRWCWTCGRIRAFKLMTSYQAAINDMKDPHFVTLTSPRVPRHSLEDGIGYYKKSLSECFRNLRTQEYRSFGISNKIDAIAKLEANYKRQTDDFNVHFHLLIDGEVASNQIKGQWLKKNTDCSPDAQDIVRVKNRETIGAEMFKYFIKIITNKDFDAVGMDAFFCATKNRRLVMTYGNIKQVNEDIKSKEIGVIDWKSERNVVWCFSPKLSDWVNFEDDDLLTDFTPDENERYLMDNLKYKSDGKNRLDCREETKAKAKGRA